ncbi:MAG: GTPase HflX [Desulfobacterales bacterium]|nr:GTPase HflX [Desulfobacterales bacterium]
MKKIFGNTSGLKPNQIKRLEKLYEHRVPSSSIIDYDYTKRISSLSKEIKRQLGIFIDRSGKIAYIVIGDSNRINIPDLSDYASAKGRLISLRYIHTHLKHEPLSEEDLTDLSLLRLDAVGAITINDFGLPEKIHIGHISPDSFNKNPYQIFPPFPPSQIDIKFDEVIKLLESELEKSWDNIKKDTGKERCILISVTTKSKRIAQESMIELESLSISSGIEVIDTIIQHKDSINPKFLMGKGKINEISIVALQKGATLLVFDQELNPSQIRSITDYVELKVIDRSQLILDIFAQRARTKEGKLQVELAQLKYMLPRLISHKPVLSRLAGGIGTRGPGETKLEMDRRRIKERIAFLEKAINSVQKQRGIEKSKRAKQNIPIVSIIGYTNAGKSTLLNSLTKSDVFVEDRLFATLDPTSRRIKFPQNIDVIITDTVGFIKDLPKDLLVAFRATLEELESADILLHVVDMNDNFYESHIESVEHILEELELKHIPTIMVFNKQDKAETERNDYIKNTHKDSVLISANDSSTLIPLINKIVDLLHVIDKIQK